MKKIILLTAFLFLSITQSLFASQADLNSPMPPKKESWQFDGVFGTFDRQSIQRGYQVYSEICASCHSLSLIKYRNLENIGFTTDEVKIIAAQYNLMDGPNDNGDMFERPARPSDNFIKPYPNENAARAANNGAYPVDLSLITKARMDGPNYVYSILSGYHEAPDNIEVPDGQYYNPYFPGRKISMPQQLMDGMLTYHDGTEASADRMARDVVNFLQWAAEPEMEDRKRMGIKVMIYLFIFTTLFYCAMKRIWSRVK